MTQGANSLATIDTSLTLRARRSLKVKTGGLGDASSYKVFAIKNMRAWDQNCPPSSTRHPPKSPHAKGMYVCVPSIGTGDKEVDP